MKNASAYEKQSATKIAHSVSAYADESITPDIIVCAAAVFPIAHVPVAETHLASMKEALGVSPTTPVHCRILFNGNERKRHPEWKKVSPDNLNAAITGLCKALVVIGHRPIAFVSKPISVGMPPAPNGNTKGTILDAKGLAAFGFQAINFHLTKLYGQGATKLWIDPDTTRIQWLNGKAQANSTRSTFMDLGPNIEPPKSEPIIETVSNPPLLEIADLYSYITCKMHTASGGWKNRWFQDLYSIVNPERFVFNANPNPKWEDG